MRKENSRFYNEQIRNPRSKKFYESAEWRALREHKACLDPLCEVCLLNDRIVPLDVVHHIVPISVQLGWEHRLDITFLQSLCHGCHNKIESEIEAEEKSRESPCGEAGGMNKFQSPRM